MRTLFFAFLVVTGAAPSPARATSFYPQPFPQTVQETSGIARGRIGMNYVEWGIDSEAIRRLYTYYELQVTEIFKGNLPEPTLTLRELGGEKDGVTMNVSGAAEFIRGDDVVVFLKDRNADGSYDLQGMSTGRYGIETNSRGQELLSGPGLGGDGGQTPVQSWSLDAFRKLVQDQTKKEKSDQQTLSAQKSQPQKVRSDPLRRIASAPSPKAVAETSLPQTSLNLAWPLSATLGGILLALLLIVKSRKKYQ